MNLSGILDFARGTSPEYLDFKCKGQDGRLTLNLGTELLKRPLGHLSQFATLHFFPVWPVGKREIVERDEAYRHLVFRQ